jgi:DtxR family transcriptional regulator, Mn-dependent transcriptional regulator
VTPERRRASAADQLTVSVEDYLKVIYDLEREGGVGGTTDIAARLHVAPASVSGMVKRLAGQGLLHYARYRGVTLTAAGRKAALQTIRRHRIIESYLALVLGYPWDRVHDEAERLEHAASDELVDRMAHAIGDPTTDPHGAPIPSREGRVVEAVRQPLASCGDGALVTVAGVSGRDADALRKLGALGLVPGAQVTVLAHRGASGTVRVTVHGGVAADDRDCQVPAALAALVYVA